jgi:predicted RNase H-like HicB family nuclease
VITRIEIKAEWDPDANVWVATSDDLPGLVTEAETVESLQQKLAVMVPDLLEASGGTASEVRSIPMTLIAHREAMISIRD